MRCDQRQRVPTAQGSPKKITDDVAALRPTLFIAVPRVLERIQAGIDAKVRPLALAQPSYGAIPATCLCPHTITCQPPGLRLLTRVKFRGCLPTFGRVCSAQPQSHGHESPGCRCR